MIRCSSEGEAVGGRARDDPGELCGPGHGGLPRPRPGYRDQSDRIHAWTISTPVLPCAGTVRANRGNMGCAGLVMSWKKAESAGLPATTRGLPAAPPVWPVAVWR